MPVASVGMIAAVNKEHRITDDDDEKFTPLPLPPPKVSTVPALEGAHVPLSRCCP